MPLPPKQIESDEIIRLRKELSDVTAMVKHLVQAWGPITPDGVKCQDNLSSETVIRKLEGAWIDTKAKTHIYAKFINGVLYAPYCYQNDNHLTGIFYNWKDMEEYIFVQFRWLKDL